MRRRIWQIVAAVVVVLGLTTAPVAAQEEPAFEVLAFYSGTWDAAHIDFVAEANERFPQFGEQHGFGYTATNDWNRLTDLSPGDYQVVMFLDDAPHSADQRAGFQRYLEAGGGFFGFHVCAFTTDPGSWSWFYETLLGSGSFRNNTWEPTAVTLRVDNPEHGSTVNLPETFPSAVSEWYSWTNDLRDNPDISILASVDPSSFPVGTDPNQSWYDGYYPIMWTNKNYRMLYANFGHNAMDYENNTRLSSTFDSELQNQFLIDGLRWLASS
ncbi:MAG: ThuA domain-containing protein [Thermocrispum sp.]